MFLPTATNLIVVQELRQGALRGGGVHRGLPDRLPHVHLERVGPLRRHLRGWTQE